MIEPFLSDAALLADIDAVHRRAGRVDLWWLGQSGYLVHHRSRWFLIDPYLSDTLTEKYAATPATMLPTRACMRIPIPRGPNRSGSL